MQLSNIERHPIPDTLRPLPAGAARPPYALVHGPTKGQLEEQSMHPLMVLAEGKQGLWRLGDRSWVRDGAIGRQDAVAAARQLLAADPALSAIGWAPIPTSATKDSARSLHLFEVLSDSGASLLDALHDGDAHVIRPTRTLDWAWTPGSTDVAQEFRHVHSEVAQGYVSRDADYLIEAATPRAIRRQSVTLGGD